MRGKTLWGETMGILNSSEPVEMMSRVRVYTVLTDAVAQMFLFATTTEEEEEGIFSLLAFCFFLFLQRQGGLLER